MIFAAGLGTRMGALTRDRPKPLIEVAGRPLIDHALALVRAAGIPRIVVNTHAHAEQMRAHLARVAPEALVSHEPELLETGGGLKRALPLLGAGPGLHPQRRHGLDRPEPARRARRRLEAGHRRAALPGAARRGGRARRRRATSSSTADRRLPPAAAPPLPPTSSMPAPQIIDPARARRLRRRRPSRSTRSGTR